MRELLEKKAILIGVVLVGAIVLAIFFFTDKSGEDISAMFAESTQVAGNESVKASLLMRKSHKYLK